MKIKIMNQWASTIRRRPCEFYTDKLGFVKKADFAQGNYRWLTVVSAEEPDGVELVLQPAGLRPGCTSLPAGVARARTARRHVLRGRPQQRARAAAGPRRGLHHAAHQDVTGSTITKCWTTPAGT